MGAGLIITAGLVQVAKAIPPLAAACLAWYLAKWVFRLNYKFDKHREIAVHNNAAYGTYFGCYLAATGLALAGTLFAGSQDLLVPGVLKTFGESLLVVVLMWLSLIIHDRLIFSHFDAEKEIGEDRNLGAAFCLGGSLLSSGLILNGSLLGYSSTFLIGLRDIVVYWAFGQLALLVGVRIYQRITRFDLHQLIAFDDNAAVGLSFAGFLISLGIVIRASLLGAGLAPLPLELLQTSLFAVMGIIALAIVRLLIDLIMLPKADLNLEISMDRNLGAAALASGVYVAAAFLLAMILQR